MEASSSNTGQWQRARSQADGSAARLLAQILLVRIQHLARTNPTAATQLIATAKRDNPYFNIQSISPWRVRSLSDISQMFGPIHNVTDILVKTGLLSDLEEQDVFRESTYEQKIIDEAARIAAIPELPLKYHNFSYFLKEEKQLYQAELAALQQEKSKLAGRQDAVAQAKLDRINYREARINAEWENLSKDIVDVDRLGEMRLGEIAIERKKLEASLQTNPPRKAQQKIKSRLNLLEKREDKEERRLIRRKVQQVRLEREVEGDVGRANRADETRDALLAKEGTIAEIRTRNEEARIIDLMESKRAGLATPPSPTLDFAPDKGIPTSQGGVETVQQGSDALRFSGFVNPDGTINTTNFSDEAIRKGTAKAREYEAYRQSAEMTIADSAMHELNLRSSDTELNSRVAKRVARDISPEFVRYLQYGIQANRGVQKANENAIDYVARKINDPAYRRKIAKGMIQEILAHKPEMSEHEAADLAQTLLEPVTRALPGTLPVAGREVEYELVYRTRKDRAGNQKIPIVIMKERVEFPDGLRVVRQESRTAIAPSPRDSALAFSRAYRLKTGITNASKMIDYFLGYDRRYGKVIVDPNVRRARLYQQLAFTSGVLDFDQRMRSDPYGTTFPFIAAMNPIQNAAVVASYLGYHLLPDSIKNASISARSSALGLASAPILGAALAPWVAVGYAGGQVEKRVRAELHPIIKPDEWSRAYLEGQLKDFASVFLPLGSLTKYDGRGRLGFGVHLLPGGWDLALQGIGSTFLGVYDKGIVSSIASGLTPSQAFRRANTSFGKNLMRRIGLRLTDRNKKRDPISMLVGILLWEPLKAVIITAFEAAKKLPVLRTIVRGLEQGDFARAVRYGSGWADEFEMFKAKQEAIASLDVTNFASPEAYQKAIAATERHFSRLYGLGTWAKRLSYLWEGGKIGAEFLIRGGLVTGAAFLLGATLPGAIGIGAAYSVPWAFRKFISTPIFGGEWRTAPDVFGIIKGGKYEAGMLSRWGWSKAAGLDKISAAANTSILNWKDLADQIGGLNGSTKLIAGAIKYTPWNGLLISGLLLALGVSNPWLLAAPIAIDLGTRAVLDWAKSTGGQVFFGPTGLWAKFTGGLGVFFQLGGLSYAMSAGGFFGLFDVFRQFSVANLLKFLSLPATYFSITSLLAVFGWGGPIGLLIGGGLTAGAVIIDEIVRYFTGRGFWWDMIAKPIVERVVDFFKNKALGFAAGVFSAIMGIFGLFQAAMRGDIQGVVFSIIMMFAGGFLILTASSAIPGAAYTPTGAAAGTIPPVIDTEHIKSLTKSAAKTSDTEFKYTYSYTVANVTDTSGITLTEKDKFESAVDSTQCTVTTSAVPGFDAYSGQIILARTLNGTKNGPIEVTFNLTCSVPLAQLIEQSGSDSLCNTLTVSVGQGEAASRTLCIDSGGNIVGGLNLPPIEAASGTITSCFGEPRGEGCHRGIDISASAGTQIYAGAGGSVEIARDINGSTSDCNYCKYFTGDPNGGMGNMILIKHDDNLWTAYGHLSKFNVSEGETVNEGDIIGEVGSTGNSTGAHLHFMVFNSITSYASAVNPCGMVNYELCGSNSIYKYNEGQQTCEPSDSCN